MATVTVKDVNLSTFVSQLQSVYDLAHRERKQANHKGDVDRMERASNLDKVLDMLNEATIEE